MSGMQPPTIVNDLSLWCVILFPFLFVFGYLSHELMHILPLALTRTDYSIELCPGEKPVWYNLTVGRAFEIEFTAHPLLAIVSLLAPGLLTVPGWIVWALILQADVVSLTLVLTVALWIIVFLPSLKDWSGTLKQVRVLRLRG